MKALYVVQINMLDKSKRWLKVSRYGEIKLVRSKAAADSTPNPNLARFISDQFWEQNYKDEHGRMNGFEQRGMNSREVVIYNPKDKT